MSDNYGNQLDTMNSAIEDAIGGRAIVFYSAYKTSKSTGDPLNNLNQVAIRGKVILAAPYDDFWGEDGKAYQSEVVEDPTWLEVAVLADAMIRTTKDTHHSFLEGVFPTKKKIDGVKVYEFSMGS